MYRDFINSYLEEVKLAADRIDRDQIHKAIAILHDVRKKDGRLFIVGVGGSAANASHAVNDFRKIAHIESYAPTDNVAELTARTNDEGWDSVFVGWLKHSRLAARDAVLVFSVGGGNAEKNISSNIVYAINHAKDCGARVIGIVSRDGGHTAKVADACVLVPVGNVANVTAHAESWQAVIWHLIVFHPKFKMTEGKWESVHHQKEKPA